MAIALNILLLGLEAWGMRLVLQKRPLGQLFQFYTQLSNMTAALSAMALLLFGQAGWVAHFRYLGTSMLLMTAFVTACVLVPMGGDPKKLLGVGSGLINHVLCPVLCIVSYLFFERHAPFRALLLPVAVTLVYGIVLLRLNALGTVDGPYPFFRVRAQSARATVLWFLALLAAVTLLSALLGVLGR